METPTIPSNTPFDEMVYEPAEDSFLMLDALEMDLPKWISEQENVERPRNIIALEAGCGSGILSTALAKFSLNEKINVPVLYALDVNASACALTKLTAQSNGVASIIESITADALCTPNMFRGIKFDLILCNPPYVPVLPEERFGNPSDKNNCLEKSWDGGPDGNSFIIPFLAVCPSLLSDKGVLYLLLSHWNSPEFLMEVVAKKNGLASKQVIYRVAGRERLSVWRLEKIKI